MESLSYIGPFFKKRFRKNNINTPQELLIRAKKLNSAELRILLESIFKNKRAKKCVPLGDRKYAVREINIKGYNSIMQYLKSHKVSHGLKYIPGRPEDVAFPKRCQRKN